MHLSKITQSLIFASVISVALIFFRGGPDFSYMIWNLFLAWVPYVISVCLIKKEIPKKTFAVFFFLWLLFFPNAPYLITDIIHVASGPSRMLWYDSMLFFFFAWVGLFIGMVSLFHIHQYLRQYWKGWVSELMIFLICFLSSFGVYLGRFERWNSWDFFISPSELIKNSYEISTNLGYNNIPLIFVGILTICVYGAYRMLFVLLERD